MTSRKQRIQLRNEKVKEFFLNLEKKHPQWKLSALLEETASQFPPIASATVSAILKESGSYAAEI